MQQATVRGRLKDTGAWIAFLAMAFAVVGMTGVVATYAAQLPLQRALAHEAALDRALEGVPTDPVQAARLRTELSEEADAVLSGPGTLAARVSAARARVREAFETEAADVGFRLRLVICVFTAVGILFGAMVLTVVRRSA